MALTKKTIVDKIEIIARNDFYTLNIREDNQILENGIKISGSFNRYVLTPDADTSTISDPVVLAQFNAVMTDTVKANYQTFLASQTEENEQG